jgi:hypothetical protein
MLSNTNILFKASLFLLITFSSTTSLASSSSQDYVFTLPDITVEYKSVNDDLIKLKAYKTRSNDQIIKGNERENFGQLEWVSLGIPKLVAIASPSSKSSNSKHLFNWSSNKDSFYTHISMLDLDDKNLLQKRIQLKYNISVGLEQIVSLPLNELKCTINLRCPKMSRNLSTSSTRELVQLMGKIENFNKSPFRLEFEISDKLEPHFDCIEKNLFDNMLIMDHTLKCDALQKSQTGRSNVLIIKGILIILLVIV